MKKNPETADRVSRTQDIRQACIGLVIGCCVAAFLYFKKDQVVFALVVVGISVSVAICAFFIPFAHRVIQKSFARLAFWVGQLMAIMLLVPLFYLFFFPARIVREIFGKDPLQLKRTGKETTYWTPRAKNKLSQYRRQF